MCIKILKQFWLIIFTIFILASCTKDKPVVIKNTEVSQTQMPNNESTMQNLLNADFAVKTVAEESSEKMCFELNFPLTIVYPDKTTTNVNSFEALETAFNSWYQENKGTKEEPMLNFPVEVTLADGTIESLTDERTLIKLMLACFENENLVKGKCFEINYPIEIQLEGDDAAIVINGKEEFESLLKGKVEEIKYEFVYPISVTLAKGEVKNLASKKDLKALKEFCGKKDKGNDDKDHNGGYGFGNTFSLIKNNCFEMAYPIEMIMPDASKISINNADEFVETIKSFRNDKEELSKISFSYPINVLLMKDEVSVQLNSQEELKELFATCKEGKGSHNDNGKDFDFDDFDFDFGDFNFDQINFEDLDLSQFDLSNLEDLGDFKLFCFEVNFPITVNITDEERINVESFVDLMQQMIPIILSNRGSEIEPTVNYPVSITIEDGTIITINTDAEFEELAKSCND